MTEPIDSKHQAVVERALKALESAPPRNLLPSNNLLGEELTRAVSRTATRHQVVRLIASQYGINGAPADSTRGVQAVEDDLLREMSTTSLRVNKFIPQEVPSIFGEVVTDYLRSYIADRASLSRWLLFNAIATVPGELDGPDDVDRQAFRDAIGDWLRLHLDRYKSAYAAVIESLGRRDRADDDLSTLTHALGMLAEGAIMRAATDPSLTEDEAIEVFRMAALGLVAVFTARQDDERSVDDLLSEVLTPQGG